LDELLNGPDKLECFVRFDDVAYWQSRTRDLITNAETYSFPAFQESFMELRREGRVAEFALIAALYRFKNTKQGETDDYFKK